MKSIAELGSTDFPDVDPVRFDAWKQASAGVQRRSWWVLPLMLAAMVGVFVLVEGFAVAVLIIVIAAAGGMLVSAPVNRAAKEAGITRTMIRQARH